MSSATTTRSSRAPRRSRTQLPAAKRDAFYELVLFPAKASAQVNALYLAAAKNALYAAQQRASTNDMADDVARWFKADGDLMTYFNKTFAGGRWDHFMDQSHIGYTIMGGSTAEQPERDPSDPPRRPERGLPRRGGRGHRGGMAGRGGRSRAAPI